MKSMRSATGVILAAAVTVIFAAAAGAAERKPIEFRKGDTVKDVIQRHVGKTVEVYLISGEKLKGKVSAVGDASIHLSELAGMDFFDAVVSSGDINAVVIRTLDPRDR